MAPAGQASPEEPVQARADARATAAARADPPLPGPRGIGLTRRVRFLFCLLTVISVVLRLGLLTTMSAPLWPDKVAAGLGLLCILGWSVAIFRRGRVPLPVEVVVPISLLAWGPVATSDASVFTMLIAAVFQRALYGTRWRLFVSTVACFAAFMGVTVARVGPEALTSPMTLTNTFGVLFSAGVMYTLGQVLREHEERAYSAAVVARSGGSLMAAQTPEAVYDAMIDALGEVLGDRPGGIGVWRMRGQWIEEVAVRGAEAFVEGLTRVSAADVPPHMQRHLDEGREFFIGRRTVAELAARMAPGVAGRQPSHQTMEMFVCPLRERGTTVGSVIIACEQLPASMCESAKQITMQAGLVLERLSLHHVVRGIVDGSADTFVTVNVDGRIEFVSAAVRDMLDRVPEGLQDTRFHDLVHPEDVPVVRDLLADEGSRDDRQRGACRLRHNDGTWRDAEISARSVIGADGRRARLLNVRDVTERKALEAEIAFRAYHDGLTGLANRTRFAERLDQALERARRTRTVFAVAFLDIDDFKTVNDSLGHAAGDRLLEVVARRLEQRLRPHDVAARFGGDEFALLVENTAGERDAVGVVQRVADGLSEPLTLDGSMVTPRASVGVVVVDDPDTADGAEIMRDADIAMYAAKRAGKGRLARFRPAMRAEVHEKHRLRLALGGALEREEFVLAYQPVLDLSSGRVAGVEALLRWNHPQLGLLPPDRFLPLAEEDGTIVEIGHWVVHETCRQLRRWHDLRGDRALAACVNMSARSLQDPALVDVITEALRAHEVPASSLVIEMAERTFIRDTDSASTMLADLRRLGVRVAIDDFGNGYSSLSYLQRFPVDYLKIDRSFTTWAGHERGGALTHAIVRLAGTLGIVAVAEGIEDDVQAARLREWGCDLGQGFLFASPGPPDALDELVRAGAEPAGSLLGGASHLPSSI